MIIYILIAIILLFILLFIPKNKYFIGKSAIHGNGVICAYNIKKDELIDVAIIHNPDINETTITSNFGKFINHKKDENTYLKKVNKNNIEIYYIYSNKNIFIGEEITSNYDGPNIPSFIEKSRAQYKQ